MEPGPIQKLLFSSEYSDIEDVVLVESVFVELDGSGDGVAVVSLGLTPDCLILASHEVVSFLDDRRLLYDIKRDLTMDGVDIKWLVPLEHVIISRVPENYTLRVCTENTSSPPRHFKLCSCAYYQAVWKKWLKRLGYVQDDPYGYIKRHSLRPSTEDLEDQSSIEIDPNMESKILKQSLEFNSDFGSKISNISKEIDPNLENQISEICHDLGSSFESKSTLSTEDVASNPGSHVSFGNEEKY